MSSFWKLVRSICFLRSTVGEGVFSNKTLDEGCLVDIFPKDNQQSILSPYCAQYIRYFQTIDREGDAVAVAEFCMNHGQVAGELDVHDTSSDVVVEIRLRGGLHVFLYRVYVPFTAIRDSGDTEKFQIS